MDKEIIEEIINVVKEKDADIFYGDDYILITINFDDIIIQIYIEKQRVKFINIKMYGTAEVINAKRKVIIDYLKKLNNVKFYIDNTSILVDLNNNDIEVVKKIIQLAHSLHLS